MFDYHSLKELQNAVATGGAYVIDFERFYENHVNYDRQGSELVGDDILANYYKGRLFQHIQSFLDDDSMNPRIRQRLFRFLAAVQSVDFIQLAYYLEELIEFLMLKPNV